MIKNRWSQTDKPTPNKHKSASVGYTAVERVIRLAELAEFDGEAALRVETLDAELEEMMGDDADGTLMMQVTTSVDTPGND